MSQLADEWRDFVRRESYVHSLMEENTNNISSLKFITSGVRRVTNTPTFRLGMK